MKHTTNGAADGDFSEEAKSTADSTKSFEDQVNAAASTMTKNDDGVWELPTDAELPTEVAFAATLEKRRRDTQSTLAKTSQERDAFQDRSSKLESKLKEFFVPELSKDQLEELEDLKSSDPEAYRKKMNEYEESASQAFEEELAEAGFDADEISVMADRATLLSEFLDENPGLVLNDDVFENDLPPRLTGKLASGEIDFPKFLEEAGKFLKGGKKMANSNKEEEAPDLNKAGGGSEASKAAVAGESEASYKNEIY